MENDDPIDLVVVFVDGGDANPPTGMIRRWIAKGKVATGRDHGAVDAVLFENLQGFVRSKALGDSPQIETHVRRQQSRRAMLAVEAKVAPSDRRASGLDFSRGWQCLSFSRE